MAEDPIKETAKRLATEYMVCHVYNMILKLVQASESQIEEMESQGLKAIGLQPIVTSDPAISDHVSAEMRDALEDLLVAAKEMRATAKT